MHLFITSTYPQYLSINLTVGLCSVKLIVKKNLMRLHLQCMPTLPSGTLQSLRYRFRQLPKKHVLSAPMATFDRCTIKSEAFIAFEHPPKLYTVHYMDQVSNKTT